MKGCEASIPGSGQAGDATPSGTGTGIPPESPAAASGIDNPRRCGNACFVAFQEAARMKRLFLLALVPWFACGGAERTGDETRSGAQEIPLGWTVDDKVSSKDDPVDNKRFSIPQAVPVVISIHWDDPSIRARWRLRDRFGAVVGEVSHTPGSPVDTLPETRLQPGDWFVEVEALKGSSVYTLEVRPGGPSGFGVPRPE